VTDSEKQAVELLFESLIKLTYSPSLGQRYEPELAGRAPRLVPLGRQFLLNPKAFWAPESPEANPVPVTAPDVRQTVQLLSDPNWAGRDPEWAELMSDGRG